MDTWENNVLHFSAEWMFSPSFSKATLTKGLKGQINVGGPKVPAGIVILGSLGTNIKEACEGGDLLLKIEWRCVRTVREIELSGSFFHKIFLNYKDFLFSPYGFSFSLFGQHVLLMGPVYEGSIVSQNLETFFFFLYFCHHDDYPSLESFWMLRSKHCHSWF